MKKLLSNAPSKVLIVGISSQIKYPKIIAKTNAKYFSGVQVKLLIIYMIDLTINLQTS